MRLNLLGRLAMNNPAREQLLVRYVGRRLEDLDPAPAGRTLVVGCGQGVDVDVALDRFRATEVVAIDLDERQVARARRRLADHPRVEVVAGDVTALQHDDATFDTVFDLGAVHLVPAWPRAYAEIARVLRPGGRLRFETIVGRTFRATMRMSTEGLRSPNGTSYTKAAVLSTLDRAGLRCDESNLARPTAMVATGLVGDLIGVATKR